jgi:ABC-2 type transport system permease protein
LLFIFLAGYFAFMTGGSALALYDLLAPVQLQVLLPGLYVSSSVLLVFVFGALYVLSVFYYASDVDKILPLPLFIRKRSSVPNSSWSQPTSTCLSQVSCCLPCWSMGSKARQPGPILSCYWVCISCAADSAVLATLLTMLIMRFTPLTKNKDRFRRLPGFYCSLSLSDSPMSVPV